MIDGVAVLATESFSNSKMLKRACNQGSNSACSDLGDESGIVSCWSNDAVSVDFADAPEKVIFSVFVDEVADEGEDDENDDSSATCDVLDNIVLLAPCLADFLKSEEDEDGSNTDAAGWPIPVWETFENVPDNGEDSSGYVTEADQAANLTESDDQGRCRDESGENWDRDVVKEKSETENTHCKRVDTDHEGHGISDLRRRIFVLEIHDDFCSQQT